MLFHSSSRHWRLSVNHWLVFTTKIIVLQDNLFLQILILNLIFKLSCMPDFSFSMDEESTVSLFGSFYCKCDWKQEGGMKVTLVEDNFSTAWTGFMVICCVLL